MHNSKNFSIDLNEIQFNSHPKRQNTSSSSKKLFFSQKRQKPSNFENKTQGEFRLKNSPKNYFQKFDYEKIPKFLQEKNSNINNNELVPIKSFHSIKTNYKFSDFLTERASISSSQRNNGPGPIEKYSNLTKMNNNLFNQNMTLINLHEKKRLNLTDRKSLDLREVFNRKYEDSGFITQRTTYENPEVPVDIERIGKKEFYLGKLAFRYCFLSVKGQESPLNIGCSILFLVNNND